MNKDVIVMSQPLLLLKKHLANIYTRIDKIDQRLAEFMNRMERMADEIDNFRREIDNLGIEKLSVKEFSEFKDEFNKALVEGLPSPDESVKEPAIEEPEKQPIEVTVQAVTGGSQPQQTEEMEKIQNEEKKRKFWLF
jgi:hypothetical protein